MEAFGMYQVGDYIVKASNGVCKVKAIVHPDFVSDKKKDEILAMIRDCCNDE